MAFARSDVAQICNLLYRRIAFGRASALLNASEFRAASGLQIRDTAECNSALRRGRRGAERSAVPRPAGPLHRADDEGFRKNLCAGKIRGVNRPEGRAPGDVMQFDLTENYERGLLRVYIPTPATKGK